MSTFNLRILGRPAVTDANGVAVRFPSRKSEALFLHLALCQDGSASRGYLCNLLWGESDEERARGSLRQCLRQLSALADSHGPLVVRDRSNVRIACPPLVLDTDVFRSADTDTLLSACREAVRGGAGGIRDILEGAEIDEEPYDEWLRDTRSRLSREMICPLEKALSAVPPGDATRGDAAEAAAVLLAAVDPFNEASYDWQLRHLCADGRRDAALRLYHRYAEGLRDDLGVGPPDRIRAFVRTLRQDDALRPEDPIILDNRQAMPSSIAPAVPDRIDPPKSDRSADPHDPGLPRLSVEIPREIHPLPDIFRFASDEILYQLSRFRELRCFEGTLIGSGEPVTEFAVGNQPFSDYRMRLSLHPKQGTIHVSVVEATTGETILRERMAGEVFAGREAASEIVARCVNAIERDVLVAHRRKTGGSTTFGRWLDALSLMSQFEKDADERALAMLEGMAADPVDSRFSLVHSSISSILMKQRLMRPLEKDGQDELQRARNLVDRALAYDRLEPFNHVIAGWAAFQDNHFKEGVNHFEEALNLNPISARTNIAAAEAFAYAGDLKRGRALAETAMRLSPAPVPTYFFGYLAMIEFMSGNADACLDLCDRAPRNPETAAVRIAALAGAGRARHARAAARSYLDDLAGVSPRDVGPQSVGRWLVNTAMFGEIGMRARWAENLSSAGIPVADARFA